MTEPLLIAKSLHDLLLLPEMSNRHGLVAGATGTGKTVTLQVMAESFSRIGVPVFAADVKGDLSGIALPGIASPKLDDRITRLGLPDFHFEGCPVTFWDIFGEEGHPIRATVSEMGPLLLSRILNLNDTQAAVLSLTFKIADDNGLLLLDLKDLQSMLQNVGSNSKQFQTQYGNISAASIGAIQRGLSNLGAQGGDRFLGEPALNIDDLLQTDSSGRGVINLLAAGRLMQAPQLYATMLLWLLSELYEKLPEAGDLPKPKLVFFFDEAHLLFNDLPPVLQSKIEQVIRLIRSKAVGVYFVTQNPIDVPDTVLSQLGNRVQHALRAFSPRDQKAVRAAADTFRANPALDVGTVITELEVGEALVSFLDQKGTPGIVERALICTPNSQIGPVTPGQRQQLMATSLVAGVYEQPIDRESAYEILRARATGQLLPSQLAGRAAAAANRAATNNTTAHNAQATTPRSSGPGSASNSTADTPITGFDPADPAGPARGNSPTPIPQANPRYTPQPPAPAPAPAAPAGGGLLQNLEGMIGGLGNMLSTTGPRGGHTTTPIGAMVNSASRAIGSQVGRALIRGVLGSLTGGSSNRR